MSDIFSFPAQYQPVLRNIIHPTGWIVKPYIYCKSPSITNLTSNNITTTGFDAIFTIGNTTSYIVEASNVDNPSWFTVISNNDNNLVSSQKIHGISGLNSGTEYEWRVVQSHSNTINDIIYCVTDTTTSEVTEETTITTEPDGPNCTQPSITNISTPANLVTHNSFTINFTISDQTLFVVQYKKYNDADIPGNWITHVAQGTSLGEKSYLISNLVQGTKYHWKVTQTNTGDGSCNEVTVSTNIEDTNIIIILPVCTQVTSKPIIITPTQSTIILQNSAIVIGWSQPNTGTGVTYNMYIDGVKVASSITPIEYEYTFTQVKNYTIQIGAFNSCTTESQATKSNVITISAINITPCSPVIGVFSITFPKVNIDFLEIGVPYNIRWEIPQYGSNILYNIYIDDILISPVGNPQSLNYIQYIFTIKKDYVITVEQSNSCTTNPIVQEITIQYSQFVDKINTEFVILCKYGPSGIELEANTIPLLCSDESINQSIMDYPIQVPTNPGSVCTTYERYFKLKLISIQSNKKVKNFKVFQNNALLQVGCQLYYRTKLVYSPPLNYTSYDWYTAQGFSLLQESDIAVNLFINNSQDGELIQVDQTTDYGVLVCQVTNDQISVEEEFYIYIQWDDFEV